MNSVCCVFIKGLRGNFLCRGENKNVQLETLSVYRRPGDLCEGYAKFAPLRQKILGTALVTDHCVLF